MPHLSSRNIIAAVVILILVPFWLPLVLRALGYYVNEPGWVVAKYAAEARDVNICSKIRIMPWRVFSPPGVDQRADCVYAYAKLAQDPSACDLLMPSRYGMSCVGAAVDSPTCWLNQNKSVRWDNHGGEASLHDCQKKDPQRAAIGNTCCHIASIAFLKYMNDCSIISDISESVLHDECIDRLAYKKLDPQVCLSIENEKLRIACTVRVRALVSSPELRTQMYVPAVDSLQ